MVEGYDTEGNRYFACCVGCRPAKVRTVREVQRDSRAGQGVRCNKVCSRCSQCLGAVVAGAAVAGAAEEEELEREEAEAGGPSTQMYTVPCTMRSQ